MLSVGLHLLTIYTPMSVWFKTAPLELFDWGVLVVASVCVFVVYWVIKKIENFIKEKTLKKQ